MKKPFLFALSIGCLLWSACTLPTGVFEKDVLLPGQQWESSFKPTISFDIRDQDTSSTFNTYLVIRHTDAYAFNNIWVRGLIKKPGDTAARSERYDMTLANNENGWLGTGMDDIWEYRVYIEKSIRFSHPGTYSITLEQVMREDPLKHLLNVGIRVEKVVQ